MKSRGIDDPERFECLRCGYCCKELFQSVELYEEDIDRLFWIYYHPLIMWFDKYTTRVVGELLPAGDIFIPPSVKNVKQTIEETKKEILHDFALDEFEMDIEDIELPFGNTLRYCPFLQWRGNKWCCLIHDNKPDICREYNCYWNRLGSGFEWMFEELSKEDKRR